VRFAPPPIPIQMQMSKITRASVETAEFKSAASVRGTSRPRDWLTSLGAV
jgi:hypothetical protein